MKLSSAFEGLTSENKFLKILSKALLLITICQLGVIAALYDKTPVLIERSSHGLEVVRAITTERSPEDLKSAVRLMMMARFDSTALAAELFLNPKQQLLREAEQIDLKSRSMSQNIVVRSIAIEKDQAIVDLDRVIAVGELRSALKAKIKINFEEVSPNEMNPYGLLLSGAEPVQNKEQSK